MPIGHNLIKAGNFFLKCILKYWAYSECNSLWAHWNLVFLSPVKSGFFLKMMQLATATGLDHFRYSGTAIEPLKTGPNRSTSLQFGWDMVKTEGTYIQVAYKNVFGHISTNIWPTFMIQRLTIREKCVWVRSNTWRDERPVATGLDRFFLVFWFFNKHRNRQPKNFRICATTTSGLVFYSWVQFDFGLFFSPANWTCKHYWNQILNELL